MDNPVKVIVVGRGGINMTTLREALSAEGLAPNVQLMDAKENGEITFSASVVSVDTVEGITSFAIEFANALPEKEYEKNSDLFKGFIDLSKVNVDSKVSIEQIKKMIKYSKNPLEIKRLNRQLNEMYKELK